MFTFDLFGLPPPLDTINYLFTNWNSFKTVYISGYFGSGVISITCIVVWGFKGVRETLYKDSLEVLGQGESVCNETTSEI